LGGSIPESIITCNRWIAIIRRRELVNRRLTQRGKGRTQDSGGKHRIITKREI